MKIEDRLLRGEKEDIIEIGILAKELLEGQRGSLLYALTNGQIWQELALKKDKETTEEKIELLGKLRSYVQLLNTIENCVVEKERLEAEQTHEEQEETPIVGDLNPHRGGLV